MSGAPVPDRSAGAPARTVFLQAEHLDTHYGQSHVLQDVSITIGAGETLGLLGRNGMGKTTLIRTLVGHVRATRGRVSVLGRDCTGERPDRIIRRGIAYVPEGRGIFPNLSVAENLTMAARTGLNGRHDWDYDRVLATFPRLTERLDHGGQQLSGGEQQMLAIGRALMTNPDLLILDEATEGLAPLVVREIWRIIAQIRTTGIATLIVDRNYMAVIEHSDRCLVLEKGRVVVERASDELAREPDTLARHLGV